MVGFLAEAWQEAKQDRERVRYSEAAMNPGLMLVG
jgi:hypothetical protein